MGPGEIARIFAALEAAGVRYLVVGGVAVVLHGHLRVTGDVDLVLSLLPENVREAMKALAGVGFRPRIPVSPEEFADPERRRAWIWEKGMRVFSLWNPDPPHTAVDLFVDEPFPFEEVYARRLDVRIGETTVPVISLEDLIDMKRAAGRPQDIADIEALERIRRLEGGRDG